MKLINNSVKLFTEFNSLDNRKPIKVYARVRPLNEDEIQREEQISVETFHDEKRVSD